MGQSDFKRQVLADLEENGPIAREKVLRWMREGELPTRAANGAAAEFRHSPGADTPGRRRSIADGEGLQTNSESILKKS